MTNEEKLFGSPSNGVTENKAPSMGAAEALFSGIKEGVGAFLGAAADIAYSPTTQDLVAHGAQGLANAIFGGGNAFVLYQHGGKKDDPAIEAPDHGLDNKGIEPQQEMKRGLSM